MSIISHIFARPKTNLYKKGIRKRKKEIKKIIAKSLAEQSNENTLIFIKHIHNCTN